MSENNDLKAPAKKNITYTFKQPAVMGKRPAAPPPIGPEIGPDPRNSIGASVSMSERPAMQGANGILFDFAYGYRVKFPAGQKEYKLRVYDLDSGMLLEEHMHKSGEMFVGQNKYYVRYRLEAFVGDNLVFEHDYNCEGQRVCIIIPDGGLGDNLAWLPYIDEFRLLRKANVTAVIGEWMIRLSKAQYPGLNFIALGTKPSLRGAYAIYFCGIFEKDRKPWRPVDHQFLGMQKSVAQILGLPLENLHCRLPLGTPRPIAEPYVCISTMATNPTKYWNYRSDPNLPDPDGWNILIRWLKSYGYRVFVLDRDKELFFTQKHHYHVPTEAEDRTGFIPISERINYLEHADFFIGLPSGLGWLAWNCNIPVVMISGFTMPNCEFPTPYRVTNFLFCHGCWNDSNEFFDAKAPVWCPRHVGTPREIECTKVITPKMVQETILRIPAFQQRLSDIREKAAWSAAKAVKAVPAPPKEIPIEKKKPSLNLKSERDATFLLPVYRANPDYLRLTIDSVIRVAESVKSAEIILFNDCSPDDSQSIIDEYAARWPSLIRKMRSSHNLGVGNARTEMCKSAVGRYVLSFDQDDIMLPFDLAGVIRMMDENPRFAASYARKFLFNNKGLTGEVHGASLSGFNAFFTPKLNINAMVIRMTDLAAHDYFMPVPDCAINDDVFLMIRLAADRDYHYDAETPRALYRVHDKQNSLIFDAKKQSPFLWMADYMTNLHPDLFKKILNNNPPDLTPENHRWVLGYMGLALLRHQREPDVVLPIVKKACEIAPDDYGAWEHCLLLLAMYKQDREFDQRFEQAMERFKGQPDKEMALILTKEKFCAMRKKRLPAQLAKYASSIQTILSTPPKIVLDNLPLPDK